MMPVRLQQLVASLRMLSREYHLPIIEDMCISTDGALINVTDIHLQLGVVEGEPVVPLHAQSVLVRRLIVLDRMHGESTFGGRDCLVGPFLNNEVCVARPGTGSLRPSRRSTMVRVVGGVRAV